VQNNSNYFYLFFIAHEFKIHQVKENNTTDIFLNAVSRVIQAFPDNQKINTVKG
jgi:hypothetical protein